MGITVGCILGMIPLLFFKDEKKKDKNSNSENDSDSTKQEKQENVK